MPDENSFDVLPRDAVPPPGLRARVISDLQDRGLVSRGSSNLGKVVLAIAAGLSLFLGGYSIGGRATPPAPDDAMQGQQYALLLYDSITPDTSVSDAEVAAEYRAWAVGLGAQFVDGEELGEQWLLGGEVGARIPSGFFIIRTDTWEDAMAIARDCPHLRRGGVVALRAIIN